MLSESERMSLREIESRLRESDGDLVRAFEILTRVGGQRPASRRRPAPAPAPAPAPRPRPGPPPATPSMRRPPVLPPARPPVRPGHPPRPPHAVPPPRQAPPQAPRSARPARPVHPALQSFPSVPAGPAPQAPPDDAAGPGDLMRLVRWMLVVALVLPLLSFGIATFSPDVATLMLFAAFGALLGLVGYAAAVAVRTRRR